MKARYQQVGHTTPAQKAAKHARKAAKHARKAAKLAASTAGQEHARPQVKRGKKREKDCEAAPRVSRPTEVGRGSAGIGAEGFDPEGFDAERFLAAMSARRSMSSSGDAAPDDAELARLLEAVTPVADHAGLRPWRFVTLRGDDRKALGRAFDEATGTLSDDPEVFSRRPLRAPLLIAVIGDHRPHPKVPDWEQRAVAAGAGHLLSLALWAAGWGVFWRTGPLVNEPAVRRLHGLKDSELLMGWLYVGEAEQEKLRAPKRRKLDVDAVLGRLPGADRG